jgi:4-phytase/acid phosphatase
VKLKTALLGAVLLGVGASAAPARDDMTVERVVMLMRHGVRPSTKFPATPAGTTREPWPAWSTAAGDLTPHGAEAIRKLGAFDRNLFVQQGLLPATGCAPVSAWSSGASRAIKTGKAFLETLLPGCPVVLDHPVDEDSDETFHPADAGLAIDGDVALSVSLRGGDIASEARRNAAAFATLERITGVPTDRVSRLKATPGDKPDLKGALGFASTAGQTVLLQYLEGMPLSQVGWGRASKADIQQILRFHPIKFRYETRPAYVAQRLAAPLAKRILDAVEGRTARITLLFGHDTNLAALGGFYDLHWTMSDYPTDDIAPGGAIGFEVLRAKTGVRYVRAFAQAQTMDQVRALTPLTGAERPNRSYLAIPGCGSPCEVATFARLTQTRIAQPTPR